MKNIVKTISLLSILSVIPGAFAATSRVSMVSKPSTRLPSIAGYIVASTNSTTTTVNGTATTYLADVDCIDNYTACIKNTDTCGADFEECTNSVLLHAKMPTCLNVLSQCSAAGRTSLFGTSDLNAIATSSTKNSEGEITAYTYPTAGSVLGQMITAAQIENRLDTDQCIKRYTSCLKKENVCGADFELCTDNKEFKKQALFCDSTLARCQSAGKTELFGSTSAAGSLLPAAGSRLADLISEGAALAVNNAVATCNKVTDQCILNACNKNPNKCIVDRPEILIRIADATNGGRAVTTQDLMEISKITTRRDVTDYIRQECQQTIGSNRFCYMTVMGKPVTKESVLTDPDNVSEVFDDMYGGQFGRFAALSDKINQIIDNFDAKTQEKCIDTISSCAMRSCGSGIGSVCYKQSRDTDGSVNLTKSPKSYQEVKSACRAVVDVDANCQYAAVLSKGGLYSGYMNDDNSVFTTLYPQDSRTGDDPIGVVATLNGILATSYNDAAIENMKKQCQTVALGCVKSLCGADYQNCYRNRTDVVSGTYDTGNGKLDRSMNKMGGILDYNIVIGLCMNTVKTASICEEHLKVAAADWRETQDTNSWDTDTVRAGWLGANTTKINKNANDVLIGCAISVEEAQTKENCVAYDRAEPINDSCDGVMDEDGCLYTQPIYQSNAEYVLENAGKTLFQELLVDVEREAQAKYNAKITKEQNMCLAQNNGGIRGASDNGSTFMWVKLKNNKIPKNYNMQGLKPKEFTASNDLYGSFCRARITVVSDDKAIQEVLGDKATAYFAVGDAFTCGSWLDKATLDKITTAVGDKARKDAGEGSSKEKIALAWGTVGPALVAGVASYFGADALQKKGNTLGGLLGNSNNKKNAQKDKNLQACVSALNSAKSTTDLKQKQAYYGDALASAKYAGIEINADMANAAFASTTTTPERVIVPTVAGTVTTPIASQKLVWDEEDVKKINDALTPCYAQAKARFRQEQINGKTYPNGENYERYLNDLMNNFDKWVREGPGKLDSDDLEEETTPEEKAQNQSRTMNLLLAGVAQNVSECKDLAGLQLRYKTTYVGTSNAAMQTRAASLTTAGGATPVATNNIDTYIDSLIVQCERGQGASTEEDEAAARKKRLNTNLIAGAAGTVVGGALGLGITASVLKAKYEGAANEAVATWMAEVGEHIQCYLGTEELGSYGDTITFTIE